MNPLISIILPTYNGSKYISKAIDSVLTQNFTDFELIIINDASTDDKVEKIILDYTSKDDRIIYIKNEENLKLTKTLNKWIWFSKWKYIARIDDDDIWIDNKKLEKQFNFLENNIEYWLVWTKAICIDENNNNIWKINVFVNNLTIKSTILLTNQFVHSSIFIRKSCLDELGLYNNDWNYVEDYELWLRIWTKYKLKNLNVYSVEYRILKSSITRQKNNEQNSMILKLIKKYHKKYNFYFLWLILRKIIMKIRSIK